MSIPRNEYLSGIWKEGTFSGKVVFCTGGSGSICSAQVRALVYLGANACIMGRNEEKVERVARSIASARAGARVLGLGGVDVRNSKALVNAAQRCAKELGSIDFVIAGAAGNFLAPLMQLSNNAFKTVIEIDILGCWNTLKAVLPYLLESAKRNKTETMSPNVCGTGGRIIFISATIQYTGIQLQTHSTVAKAGIDALSVQAAIELGPRPILGTEGMNRLIKDYPDRAAAIPVGTFGSVRQIADAAVYLFSEAGDYINGATLVVDGGAWHTRAGEPGSDFAYPQFLLSNRPVTGFKLGDRREKL